MTKYEVKLSFSFDKNEFDEDKILEKVEDYLFKLEDEKNVIEVMVEDIEFMESEEE